MAEDRKERVHVVSVRASGNSFVVVFSDDSQCSWDTWIASGARWHRE